MHVDRAERYPELARHRRKITFLIPKEHGAWAMLLIPYVTGAAALGSFSLNLLAGLVGILLLYISRPPLILLLKRKVINGEFGAGAPALLANLLIVMVPGAAIFLWMILAQGQTRILYIGLAALMLMILHTWLSLSRKERSAPAEFIGVAMLTLTALLGGYLASGPLDRHALALWILNALYFGASIYYVKIKRRSARGHKSMSPGQKPRESRKLIIYLAVLAVTAGLLVAGRWAPALSLLSFVPAVANIIFSIIKLGAPVNIRREGWTQSVYSLVFAAVLIVSFRAFV